MGRVWSWETLHDRMWTLVYNYLPPPKLFSELVLNTVYTKIQLLIFSDEFGLRRSLSVSIMCRRAAIPTHSSDLYCTCYLWSVSVLLACASALLSGLCSLCRLPLPSTPPLPSVKSPRGPDHSEANMWFELASQKQALRTWGWVCVPRARWSSLACVVYNREYVFVQLIVFMCVLHKCMPVSLCVCMWILLMFHVLVVCGEF